MKMTFENLPQEVIDQSIDIMIASNPTMKHSRSEWFELVKSGYDIKTIKTDSYTHIFLEPKELTI